jgi:hypothetical protein
MMLNVSFGIYAFLPQGWIFMLFVILFEAFLFSKLISNKYFELRAYSSVFISNLISGIFGIMASLKLNGGWWIVVWFPWVSKNEVDRANLDAMNSLYLIYGIAFCLTLIIEVLVNTLILRKKSSIISIVKSTVLVNILSYIIGTYVLYSYSF